MTEFEQLGRRAIEWIANENNICYGDWELIVCRLCKEKWRQMFQKLDHKPTCLHILCRDYLATATATATGAEK